MYTVILKRFLIQVFPTLKHISIQQTIKMNSLVQISPKRRKKWLYLNRKKNNKSSGLDTLVAGVYTHSFIFINDVLVSPEYLEREITRLV